LWQPKVDTLVFFYVQVNHSQKLSEKPLTPQIIAMDDGRIHEQAEPLTVQEEELWEKTILGDHSPESLLNTIIFMNGLYFAL